ncbi:hypothetical protein C5167_030094 [Papaver somniferum]|nr:hypothetical protein C5167_030094 [Papaver somniferum]
MDSGTEIPLNHSFQLLTHTNFRKYPCWAYNSFHFLSLFFSLVSSIHRDQRWKMMKNPI